MSMEPNKPNPQLEPAFEAGQLDPKAARKTLILAGGILCGMVGLVIAAVPLYNWFCNVTGYNGTTRAVVANEQAILDRDIVVRFDANIARDLNWDFKPAEKQQVKIGESHTVYYTATNNSDVPVTGMAVFNVSPFNAAAYFSKMQCFCFNEQTLQPGESVEMAVSFFVDPTLDQNSDLDTLTEITLSYTMQHALDSDRRSAQVDISTVEVLNNATPIQGSQGQEESS